MKRNSYGNPNTPLSILLACMRIDRLLFGIALLSYRVVMGGARTVGELLGMMYDNNNRN